MEAGFILTVDSTRRSPLAQTDLAQTETRPFPAPLIEVVCGVPVVTKYILLIIGTASSYGQAFRKRRCLIPADGFYEWRKVLGGKIPYNIQMKDGRPFAFAGLWEGWKPPSIWNRSLRMCRQAGRMPGNIVSHRR